MKFRTARWSLIAVFLGCLAVQVVLALLAFSRDAIASDDLISLLVRLLAVYVVPFGVILGCIFSQLKRGKGQVSVGVFILALVLALGWNGLLVVRSVMFGRAAFDPDREDSVGDLMSYLQTISAAASWLVSGALAFFFGKAQ